MDAEYSITPAGTLTAEVPAQATSVSRPGLSWTAQIFQAAFLLTIGIASYLFVSHFVVQSVRVTGASMQPSLHSGQTCMLNRWIYYFRAPRRGDVVVLRDPSDNGLAVKRIIGVAGDTIALSEGVVVLNSRPITEPYVVTGMKTYPGERYRKQLLVCPPGSYVVMGDNRMNSTDSRNYGPVKRGNIVGLILP